MYLKKVTGEEIRRLRHWTRFQEDATIYDAAYLICDRSHERTRARMNRSQFRRELGYVLRIYCRYKTTTKYRMSGGLPYRVYKSPVDPIVTSQERFGRNLSKGWRDKRQAQTPLALIVDLVLK